MTKLAVRILILSMFTTSLLVVPLVTEVSATTSSKHMKKKRVRLTHQSPKAADIYASPFNSKYDEDFDRRNAGGGGGY